VFKNVSLDQLNILRNLLLNGKDNARTALAGVVGVATEGNAVV
jgi:hypothetical protein